MKCPPVYCVGGQKAYMMMMKMNAYYLMIHDNNVTQWNTTMQQPAIQGNLITTFKILKGIEDVVFYFITSRFINRDPE